MQFLWFAQFVEIARIESASRAILRELCGTFAHYETAESCQIK
jgi:hypothetical protein